MKNKTLKIFYILIFFQIILKCFLITKNIDVLIEKYLCDDAFYYHSIAQNIINGKGIVFNEGIFTNGFHPLYLIILLPIHYLFSPNLIIPIYFSMGINSIFSILTSIFIFKTVKRIFNEFFALITAIIWLFSPTIIFLSLSGLETSLQVFLISLLTYLTVKKDKLENFTIKESFYFGLLNGLIFLSRMDGIFFIFCFFLKVFYDKIQIMSRSKNRNLLYNFKDLLLIGFFSFLCVFPWLLWSYIKCGSIYPVSGNAVRLFPGHTILNGFKISFREMMGYFGANRIARFNSILFYSMIIIIVISFVGIFLFDIAFIKKTVKKFNFLILNFVIFFIYYIVVHRHFQLWYFHYPYFVFGLIIPPIILQNIQNFFRSIENKLYKYHEQTNKKFIFIKKNMTNIGNGVFILFLFTTFIISGTIQYSYGWWPCEKSKYESSLWINQNISEDEKIGSFNTGIIQYFSINHDVINLDGVVNYETYNYRLNNSIENFILSNNISYLIDTENVINELNWPENVSLIILKRIDTSECPIPYFIFQIIKI